MKSFGIKKNKLIKRRALSFLLALATAFMAFSPYLLPAKTVLAAQADMALLYEPVTEGEGMESYDVARTYVPNTPLRLEASKIKTQVGDHEGIAPKSTTATQENTVTYKYSGRVDGSETYLVQTYSSDLIELAYSSSGIFLGYGWLTGTKEYLESRKENEATNNESVEIIYNGYGVFDGYAYITRTLETADDMNRYVAGAVMTLYDAVEVYQNDNIRDDRFDGVVVERNDNGDVTNMYVQKGYAGEKIEYVLSKGEDADPLSYDWQDEINDTGDGIWIAQTVQRSDTPILYYSLSGLHITTNDSYVSSTTDNEAEINKIFGSERFDADRKLYGFDKKGKVLDITQTDQTDFSAYAFKSGSTKPVFEFAGGDFNEIRYDGIAKTISVGAGTIIYHLDEDGNRDSMADPQTGMAYVPDDGGDGQKIFVWPVNIYKDGTGSKTMEKITTSRIATINADTKDEYITGTYDGDNFIKELNPTLDENGLPIYYQRSEETYIKGEDRYDRDGDYLGYAYSDLLDSQNDNAYMIKDHDDLYNGDADDPFDQSTQYQYSSERKIKLTIDMDGNYIVNGADSVPIPVRDGRIFAGWLIAPDKLTDGGVVNARWSLDTSISAEERDRWYSNRAATGETKTITVTFQANGGLFVDDSGDIHSADNKLYYRQGESYLIENTWTTGENTPNDPFDVQTYAAIDQTSSTNNDPYTDQADQTGQTDVLKRVLAGTYIMEELSAPAGYVKGFPVGITVEESDEIQRAEMIDKTTKIEISKVDGTDSYQFHVYIDGELSADSAKTPKTVTEAKGSYSYKNVEGAVLALYALGTNKLVYSDWIHATAAVTDDNKKQDPVYGDYITFRTDAPIFLENLPTGNYIIREIATPAGYVTAPDQYIMVTETEEVQTFLMNDDHTKVEIKKYYNDGNGNKIMPNIYRAGLELKDADGETVSGWYTDDVTDYTAEVTISQGWFARILTFIQSLFGSNDAQTSGFMSNYESQIATGNTDISTLSWLVARTATKKAGVNANTETWILSDGSQVVIEDGHIPDTAPVGFLEAYNSRNLDSELDIFTYQIIRTAVKKSGNLMNQIWEADNGSFIHISVYGANGQGEDGKQDYIFEYKFNYKNDFTGAYENTVSYDTADGIHRFDYLPVGSYILHESDVPEGFTQADNVAVVVQEIGGIQQFTMKNVQRELVVNKYGQDSNGTYYAGIRNGEVTAGNKGIEIAGAKLRLYRTDEFSETYDQIFKDGSIPKGAILADEWVTGSDGTYTEQDYQKELIPKGYQVGDLKPHTIRDLEDGYYYLVEIETPDYYRTADPVRVEINSKAASVAVVNQEMSGKISVSKKNQQGSGLEGAVFLIRNKTLGTIVGTIVTNTNGQGTLIIDDIGTFTKDGVLMPYTFAIEETNPPAGYQTNDEIHEFAFKGDVHTGYALAFHEQDAAFSDGVLTVIDTVSVITISKSDYTTGMKVPGAVLSVYEAIQESGIWKKTGVAIDTWATTALTNTHAVYGLTAGKCYVLTEEQAPDGYTKAKDLFFLVSEDGKRIADIWYDAKGNPYISFTSDSAGAVESIYVGTRAIAGSYAALTHVKTGEERIYGGTASGFTLTKDEITDGDIYCLKEIVRFTDGSQEVIGITTFTARLKNGMMKIYPNSALTSETTITDSDGNQIASFESDGSVHTIDNPMVTDLQGISIQADTGNKHATIKAGDQVIYVVAYEGNGKEIVLLPDSQTDIIRTEPAAKNAGDGTFRWMTEEESGVLKFIATVKESASGCVNQRISIGERMYSHLNPVAVNSGEGIFKDTSKISIYNDVSGTHPDNGLASFTYKITLTDLSGNTLSGAYDYRTKNGLTHSFDAYGTQKSFEVTLNGADFILISDLPYNASYTIELLMHADSDFSLSKTIAEGVTKREQIAHEYFTSIRNLTSDRILFTKNNTYTLSEMVTLSGGSVLTLAKYSFTLGENCEATAIDFKNRQTQAELLKTDSSGIPISGAGLQVRDLEDNVMHEWTSGEETFVLTGVLEPEETYILHEVLPPSGYSYAKDMPFTISGESIINRVILSDTETGIKILKVSTPAEAGQEGTEKEYIPLSGATLSILDSQKLPVTAIKDTSDFSKREELCFVSTRDGVDITGLLNAGETYYLHEVKPAAGYAYADDVAFIVDKWGEITKVVMVDKPIEASFRKTDIAGEEEVIGAMLSIIDSKGNMVETWVSDGSAHVISKKLNAGETYIFRENIAPDGYAYAKDIIFSVTNDGKIEISGIEMPDNAVIMKDAPTHVSLSKTDITTREELPGATLTIRDKDGNIVETWVSGTEPHEIIGKLIAGETYTLREESAPDGYAYAEEITFTVSFDGSIDRVVMEDKPTHVNIAKVSGNTSQLIGGAHLKLIDAEGNLVDEWDSVEGQKHNLKQKLIAGAVYTLVETKAPAGYKLAGSITFTVGLNGEIDEIIMRDFKPDTGGGTVDTPKIILTKYDGSLNTRLSGAEFAIYNPDGSLYQNVTTGANGTAVFTRPQAGTYTYRETKAPDGYLCSDEIFSFTVNDNGYVNGDFIVKDYKSPEVTITKEAEDTKTDVDKPIDTENPDPGDKPDIKAPATGDNFNGWMLVITCILSLTIVLFIIGKKNKK